VDELEEELLSPLNAFLIAPMMAKTMKAPQMNSMAVYSRV